MSIAKEIAEKAVAVLDSRVSCSHYDAIAQAVVWLGEPICDDIWDEAEEILEELEYGKDRI